MKKWLVILVALLALLLCATAWADTCGDYAYEVLEDGTACITKYNGQEENLVIPGELNGVTVTRIGDEAFDYCTSLMSITIPDSVLQMGANPFVFCKSLETVNVSPTHTMFATIDGVLFNKQSKTMIWYPMTSTTTAYAIPNGTK